MILFDELCVRLYDADKKGHNHLKIDCLDCEMQQIVDCKKEFFKFYGIKIDFERYGCILSWKSGTFVNSTYFSDSMQKYICESNKKLINELIEEMRRNRKNDK